MALQIMIQGTMSGAGKSLMAAALCRIFYQDGYSCAPFKSQNMALNSFVTEEGLELGRSQAMQAEAAGIKPLSDMNPLLLKPTGNSESQIVLNGKPVGNMSAREYYRIKDRFLDDIMASYSRLSSSYDIIVIEGAGSPAELNLKSNDFVNMGFARAVGAPVLLVGDIERGGIFAQLFGTLKLLEEERSLVKALIVNKFRGDIGLFDDGRRILEDICERRVLGVVPYTECDIEDEDSLSEKLSARSSISSPTKLDIAVIRLPRISNFTDFDVFSQYPQASVRYVEASHELGSPDFLIIPGTKNTIEDLRWLKSTGLADGITDAAGRGTAVFGICGGYQMLGTFVSDPDGAECGGIEKGLGLLEVGTVFEPEKVLRQTEGRFLGIGGKLSSLSGAHFKGYEIHMGKTTASGPELLSCGGSFSGNVYGCYVHGIFDSPEVSERLIRALLRSRGISYIGGETDRKAYKERQYDILADAVRKSIDMELLYKILKNGA